MKIRCCHEGCSTMFQSNVETRAFLRLQARKSGWGYKANINMNNGEIRGMDYCPTHTSEATIGEA